MAATVAQHPGVLSSRRFHSINQPTKSRQKWLELLDFAKSTVVFPRSISQRLKRIKQWLCGVQEVPLFQIFPGMYFLLSCENCVINPKIYRLAYQPVTAAVSSLLTPARSISLSAIALNVRNHFPRPSEVKRVKRHGWKARMSSHNGRKIIMRRILKGRYVLTHQKACAIVKIYL